MQRIYQLIIVQSICVILVLSVVLFTKYFFKDTYNHIKTWYTQNVMVDTDINEVLSDEI